MSAPLYIDPPKGAKAAARRGLAARAKAKPSDRGGLTTQEAGAAGVGSGVARARDIAAGKRVDARRVKSFFDRHAKSYESAKAKGLAAHESKAIQAWLLWGGDPMRRAATRAVARADAEAPNPSWTVDGVPVQITETPLGAFDLAVSVGGHHYHEGGFPTEDAAVRRAIALLQEVPRPIGVIGDVSPIEHDGGVVSTDGQGGHDVVYFQTYSTNGDERVSVYGFSIEPDVIADLDWVDWDTLAASMGISEADLERHGRSKDPMERATVYEDVGRYYGFGGLGLSIDTDLSIDEAEEQYADLVNQAHAAERMRRGPNPAAARKDMSARENPGAQAYRRLVSWDYPRV